ncbi:hypothetical protein BH10ACI4_BH10ACI4_17360 [soil metagenome]
MNFSVERLRIWLLVGAGLLVAVIGAFLGYAHYRAHRFLTGLPGKMGMDIQQETNAFTYSQSVKGKTIYTIHAAKALKRKDGKVTLDDVGIVLYGRGDGSNSDRVDRIYGKEFEYDQGEGVVRAMGEVHIDLQAPAPVGAGAKVEYAKGKEVSADSHVHEDDHLIHVKTSGLVFLQKLGVAATDQDLEFEFNGMTGHAHGADFSSDTGLLVLQSAVKVNGVKDGKPTVLTASRAELDRQRQQVLLSHAVYTVVERDAGTRIAKGERVTAYMRRDGGVERAQAEGGVSLADASGTVTAQRGEVHLNAVNKPQAATLTGEVRFATEDPLRQAQGQAQEVRAAFDSAGALQHVTMSGGVRVHERTRGSAQEAWGERELTAKGLELAMASGSAGDPKHVVLKDAKATGEAKLTTLIPAVAGAKAGHTGAASSALSGDVLTASFIERDGGMHVKEVHGAGRTTLRRVSETGAVATSSGDSLDATFHGGGVARGKTALASGAKRSNGFGAGGDEIVTAVQQGHVVMTSKAAAKAAAAKGSAAPGIVSGGEQKATANRASYDGATEKMTLTGGVQVSDGDSNVSADRVVMEQQTGDAVADGAVKASYSQPGQASQARQDSQAAPSAEVVHVLAARGELKHDAGLAIFYGAPGHPARLWQGASQVEAPMLQFEQKARRMVAQADGPGMDVHAVFVNSGSLDALGTTGTTSANATSGKASVIPGKAAGPKRPVPVRVASHEMTYSDLARRADFNGGVLVEDGAGTMRAQQATVFLQAAATAKTAKPAEKQAFMGGSVDRVVASGHIDIVQPGRRATGEQVVYTAADGLFVLTGTPALPPRMMDETRGQITGASMSFHAGDNGVVVANGPDGATGQRVRTVTRVKQ